MKIKRTKYKTYKVGHRNNFLLLLTGSALSYTVAITALSTINTREATRVNNVECPLDDIVFVLLYFFWDNSGIYFLQSIVEVIEFDTFSSRQAEDEWRQTLVAKICHRDGVIIESR